MTNKDRAYQGKKEDGTWEQFMWNEPHEPTPENTGYTKVELIDENSSMEEDDPDTDLLSGNIEPF